MTSTVTVNVCVTVTVTVIVTVTVTVTVAVVVTVMHVWLGMWHFHCHPCKLHLSSNSSRNAAILQQQQQQQQQQPQYKAYTSCAYFSAAAGSLIGYFSHNNGCLPEEKYLYTKLVIPYSTVSDATGSEDLRLCSQPGAVVAFSMSKLPVFRMSVRGTCCKARPENTLY